MSVFGKLFFVLLLIFTAITLSANEHDENVRKILNSSGLHIDFKEVEKGKTLSIIREDQEKTDSAIALSMILYVKAPYKDVLQRIKKGDGRLSDYKYAKQIYVADLNNFADYFNEIGFVKSENDEYDKLFEYERDNSFNLSIQEINKLNEFKKKFKNNRQKGATKFYQEILKARFEAYLKRGIDGISAYEHCDKDATVESCFKKSSLGMNVFRNYFKDMYKSYMDYPKLASDDINQKFFIIKDKIDGRVAFVLKHQMLQSRDNLMLIAERQFYISNSLDAIQTQILCTPYKSGSIVVLSVQSYTDKVSGFARGVAVRFGRSMMKKQIKPMFDDLEEKFNKK